MSKFLASVAVLTHTSKYAERNALSKLCLESLRSTIRGPYEILVFDNTEPKLTLGAARNKMLEGARGEYLVISDDDILFLPGWLEKCISLVSFGERFLSTPLHQPRVKRWEMESYMGYRQNRS